MFDLIPAPYRILAMLLLLLAGISAGVVVGLNIESNRRDAQDLKKERQFEQQFQRALQNGKKHADNFIEWQRKARTYYLNWQEKLKNANDDQLAECHQKDGVNQLGHGVLLSATWVGMYNAAWLPEFDQQGDTGGAAYSLVETGTVTPREALDNIRINADLCAEDRKRHNELIDHLKETE